MDDNPCLEYVPDELKADARRLLAISPLFVSLLRTADEEGCRALFQPLAKAVLPDASSAWVSHCDSDDIGVCMRHLRQCKQRGMRHIIWWEMGVHGDIQASYRAISDFASALLEQALAMAVRLTISRFGSLEGGAFCVIGLGKLGGYELNLGSDVDPLFIWQGEGSTSGGRKQLSAAEYYSHISRMLIRLMSERTADGMVWPVDMRLRPGGDAAAIALSLDATLDFYQNYGQTWERAMLIKARAVAGDTVLGQAFIDGIAGFIYRRYLDYTTVAALADMKRRIDQQAGGEAMAPGFDVKRGQGGIREIEFIIQSMQLLHGGSRPELRTTPSIVTLEKLSEFGVLEAKEASALAEAYCFWRRVEHAIQARVGEQTQKLPDQFEVYLQAALGESDILVRMQAVAAQVQQSFTRHILPHETMSEEGSWLLGGHMDELAVVNEKARQRICRALEKIDAQLLRDVLPERSRRSIEIILSHAMPRWLDDANGVTAIEAFADLVHGIAGRATWIDLLATHKGALDWLIGVLSASRYLAEHIVQDPSWLEWPLMVERRESDIQQLCSQLEQVNADEGLEQALANIGRLVGRARLLSALAIDAHAADPMTIGAWLADTADAATAAALRLCLHDMDLPSDFPFVALAMGKHGSREMGLVSDLDMVFVLVHDDPRALLGKRSFGEHAQCLGRRMIRYLTNAPPFGAGYEFDARLRPSGSSGVLVTSLNAFREYQLYEAQTWEHQALCRARAVAGIQHACRAVESVVDEVLGQSRDRQSLAADVMSMRQKMLQHLASKTDAYINLKQDAGGLVDIEFLAQYARLAFTVPARRTVDILGKLAGHRVPDVWLDAADMLMQSYLDYRQMENALRVELWQSIGHLSVDAGASEWETMRRHTAICTPEALIERMSHIHRLFHALLADSHPK